MDVWQACALSLLVFTGASQFAFVGVVAAGGAPLAGTATALLLGSRNLFYGLAMAPRLRVRGWRRLAAAQVVIDESTAMGLGQHDHRQSRLAFHLTGWTVFVLWNLMTLVGAAAGTALGDPRTYGLDAAVGAAPVAPAQRVATTPRGPRRRRDGDRAGAPDGGGGAGHRRRGRGGRRRAAAPA
nr:AzlC family ABC transporter permease [Nocardioides thalensis]